jgi:peptide/nickel transport system substrate-binding protein
MKSSSSWLRGLLAGAALSLAATPVLAQKTLRAVVHADLKILDPVWTTAYISQRHAYLVYDTLFSMDESFTPRPQMVGEWKVSDDKLTWTFTLRPGQTFHDGQKVRSADVIASLTRWSTRDPAGQKLNEFLARYEAVDDDTFRIVLKEPYSLVLETLGKAGVPAFMMPERVARTPASEQITDPTGSGPFIMKKDEWRPGNRVVYVRNPTYVPRSEPANYLSGGKVAKLDRVEWRYIPDNNTTLSALMAGEIDYFEAPPLDFIKLMKENPDITVLNIDKLGVQGLIRMNSLHPPFNDFKARQALMSLIDQEQFMQAVVGDPNLYLKFCGAFFMCGSENETTIGSEPMRAHDIARAKALFAEAGYKGEKIVVLYPTDRPQYAAATTVLVAAMRKAGLNVDMPAADWSTINARRARKDAPDKGGWNIFITTQGGTDASSPIGNVWFNSTCDRANPGWACDADLMALVDKWVRAPDATNRRARLEEVQARGFVSLPYIPFGQFFQPIAFRKNVTGVLAAGVPVYWNIDKK